MVKNKWYECPHWTYKANRGWLIERGIVAFHWSNSQGFHWSIFPRSKWKVLWETPKSFPSRPRRVSEEKTRQKLGEKKSAENYLPYTSRYVTSYEVISGDFRWCNFRWRHFRWYNFRWRHDPTHDPPQILVRFNMIYYWRGFASRSVNYKKGWTRFAAASEKVYQLLAHGRWFSPGTPASSTTKTGRHDIAEILQKVALSTKNQSINQSISFKFMLAPF